MRALFWLLVLAVVAVGLALAARYNEGYVLLVLPPWRAEVSLNLFLVLCAGGVFVIYLLARAVSHTLACRAPWPSSVGADSRTSGPQALRDAWRLLQEGRYGHACALPRRFPPTIRRRACWPWPDGAPPTPCATSRVSRNGRRGCGIMPTRAWRRRA
jgi:uncharacterized protein HemY